MNYKIEISYDGILFTDISGIVIRDSIEIIQSLYEENSLMPDANNASFRIIGDDTIVPHLLNREEETVCRITLDDVQVFEGIISPNCSINTTINGIQPITLRVEDYTISKLKRKFSENIERIGIPICDPLDTQNSAVHIVASMAGVEIDSATVPTITSIDYQFVAETSETYFESLYKMLFEFGFIFYFNGMGKLAFYNLGNAPSDLSTITKKLSTIEENITESIGTSITRGSKDKITVTWEQRDYFENVILWKDDAKGTRDGDYWAFRAMGPTSGWPCYSKNKDDVAYVYYSIPEGEVLYATDVQLHFIIQSPTFVSLYQPLANYGKKCSFRFWNSDQGGYPRYVCNTYIYGNAWVKRNINNSFVYIPDQLLDSEVQDEYQYECKYIYSKEQADNFLKILQNYFKYSANTYKTNSYDKFNLGDYVKIEDDIHQTFTGYGRIRKIVFNNTGSYTYFIEGIDEYVNTVSSGFVGEYYPQPVYVTAEKLVEGTLPIVTDDIEVGGGTLENVDHITGSIAGISASTNKLFLGAGTYNSADTPFYVDNTGKFSLKNKLSFDGTNLVVNGSGTFSGSVTATSGSFTGTISTSNITATGGTIGGFTLGASSITGGSLILTSGGNIVAGTGNDLFKVSAADATNRLWIGNADSALAPFKVSKTGALTATGATISGAITATSGSFTGSITATSGTLSNLTVNGAITVGTGGTITGTGYSLGPTSSTIGGFTLASTTLTGGSLTLTNTGNISAGTSNDIARISADDATYRLWIGNATSSSAPFRVTKAGVLTASGATISGSITATSGSFTGTITTSNITATGGTVGSWILGTDKLSSASTGSRIELNKAKSRVSIFDSGNNEKVVQGYLQGLLKNGPAWDSTKAYVVGDLVSKLGVVYKAILGSTNVTPPNATYWQVSTDTWTSSDYGFWISPSTTATFDGTIETKNGGLIASDGGVRVKIGGLDSMLLGTENGRTGLHMNLNSTPVRIAGNSGGLSLQMNNIDTSIYSPTNVGAKWKDYTAFETGATKGFAFDDQVHVESGLFLGNLGQIYFQNIDRTDYKCILTASATNFSFRLADTSTLSISDGTEVGDRVGMINLKVANCQGLAINGELALGHDISRYNWSTYGNANITGYNLNNAEISVKSSTGTDSNTVYIKDGTGKLKERSIYSGVWTGAASTSTTSTTATKWATGRTITLAGDVTGTSIAFDGSANLSITTTVADNSHSHTVSNLSDIQSIRPVGEMTIWTGTTIPSGWLLCDGRAVSRTTYSALWMVLGTMWGVGDGSTTFNVPDMRGACPAGVGTSVGYSQNETIALTMKYDDQFQGHKVETTYLRDSYGGSTGGGVNSYKSNNANTFTSTWGGIQSQTIVTDGTNGNPRIGNITRGKVVGVHYIIRY